jgi:hypothetical protein
MKPSGKFQGFATSTPEHDMLQLWCSNPENQKKIADVFRDEIAHRTIEDGNLHFARYGIRSEAANSSNWEVTENDIILKMEHPVFGYNKFLIGIIDGLIDVASTIDCSHERVKGFRTRYQIVYDIKPQLNSISQAMGQITTYADLISREKEVGKLIITSDENTKFDNMLLQQGIRVLHVKENELIK